MRIELIMETVAKLKRLKVEVMAEYLRASNWRMRKNFVDLETKIDFLIDRYMNLDVINEGSTNIETVLHLFNVEVNLVSEFYDLREKNQISQNFCNEGIVIKVGSRLPRTVDLEGILSKEDFKVLEKKLH